MLRPRIKDVAKVASSNQVKSYRLKQGAYQTKRTVKYIGMSHQIRLSL